jgi:hypothetical protein
LHGTSFQSQISHDSADTDSPEETYVIFGRAVDGNFCNGMSLSIEFACECIEPDLPIERSNWVESGPTIPDCSIGGINILHE